VKPEDTASLSRDPRDSTAAKTRAEVEIAHDSLPTSIEKEARLMPGGLTGGQLGPEPLTPEAKAQRGR